MTKLQMLALFAAVALILGGCGGGGVTQSVMPVVTGMIDTHCHILPAVDDGAADMPMALQMARVAAADGIRTIIATPHWDASAGAPDLSTILARTQALRTALAQANIPICLEAGAEIALCREVIGAADANTLPTMAGSRYVLVEFQKDTDWTLGRQVITHLIQGGYRPILAHPELAPQVQADYTRAAALKSEGVRLQVIAPSLRGLLGSKPLELAKQLLRDGLADLLATDAHRPELRLPQLTPAQAVVTGIAGADKFRSLTVTEALKILQDEP